jgi:hypothetical protein
MRRNQKCVLRLACAATVVACGLGIEAVPASAHNAGCVTTGNGAVVSVGSGKDAPFVGEQNPHRHDTVFDEKDAGNLGRLDLVDGPGDQFGARFAADQGHSAVERPTC